MVFSGLYPVDGDDYPQLRDALDKLRLNDAALVYEPETSTALGFGFRCGFLGLLHMEIVRERLEREFDLTLISTAPNVVYRVVQESGDEVIVTNPSEFPDGQGGPDLRAGGAGHRAGARPSTSARSWNCARAGAARCCGMDYLSADRVEIRYTMPLAEIIFDFFDQLKSRTRGYASLDYEPAGEQEASLVKVDILLQGQPVDAFSQIVHADKAREYGIAMTSKLRELIPRQQFEVPIQAAIGSRIIARENIRALRKDVLAKCYGGDITRKRKLLEKQKEGKRRMKTIGRVEVPQEAFIAALSTQPDKLTLSRASQGAAVRAQLAAVAVAPRVAAITTRVRTTIAVRGRPRRPSPGSARPAPCRSPARRSRGSGAGRCGRARSPGWWPAARTRRTAPTPQTRLAIASALVR